MTLVAEKDYRLSISEGAFVSGTTKNVAIDIDFNTKNPNIYAVEEFHYTAGSELEGQGGWVVSTASATPWSAYVSVVSATSGLFPP